MPDPRLDPETRSVNVAATGLVKKGGGYIYGLIISSHTNGTLKLWDNTSAALDATLPIGEGLIHDTITFAAGPQILTFPTPIPFANGLFATVGGTLNCQAILSKH